MQTYQQDYHQLIEIEAPGFNSTLSPYETCTNANNSIAAFGTTQAGKWATVYLAAAQKRLTPFITGLPLSPSILVAMQQTCAYEVGPVFLPYIGVADIF